MNIKEEKQTEFQEEELFLRNLNLNHLPKVVLKTKLDCIAFSFLLLGLHDDKVRTILNLSRITEKFWNTFRKLPGYENVFDYFSSRELMNNFKYIYYYQANNKYKLSLIIKAFFGLTMKNKITNSSTLADIGKEILKALKLYSLYSSKNKTLDKEVISNYELIRNIDIGKLYFDEEYFSGIISNKISNNILKTQKEEISSFNYFTSFETGITNVEKERTIDPKKYKVSGANITCISNKTLDDLENNDNNINNINSVNVKKSFYFNSESGRTSSNNTSLKLNSDKDLIDTHTITIKNLVNNYNNEDNNDINKQSYNEEIYNYIATINKDRRNNNKNNKYLKSNSIKNQQKLIDNNLMLNYSNCTDNILSKYKDKIETNNNLYKLNSINNKSNEMLNNKDDVTEKQDKSSITSKYVYKIPKNLPIESEIIEVYLDEIINNKTRESKQISCFTEEDGANKNKHNNKNDIKNNNELLENFSYSNPNITNSHSYINNNHNKIKFRFVFYKSKVENLNNKKLSMMQEYLKNVKINKLNYLETNSSWVLNLNETADSLFDKLKFIQSTSILDSNNILKPIRTKSNSNEKILKDASILNAEEKFCNIRNNIFDKGNININYKKRSIDIFNKDLKFSVKSFNFASLYELFKENFNKFYDYVNSFLKSKIY